MTNLDDGFDEVIAPPSHKLYQDTVLLCTPLPRAAEEDYHLLLTGIKIQYRGDMIAIYTSPEFRSLRDRLVGLMGEVEANDIMNNNL